MCVKEDFVDTDHNLTYKGVAALRWVDTYCRHTTFVLKTDDDIFVNMFSLIRYLKKMTRETPRPDGLLMCSVSNVPVQRSGKWKVCFCYAFSKTTFKTKLTYCVVSLVSIPLVRYVKIDSITRN